MSGLLSKFVNLINRDVQSENEVKMTAVVVRVNAVIWVTFFLLCLLLEIASAHPAPIILCTAGLLLSVLIFDLTYQNKTRIAAIILLAAILNLAFFSIYFHGASPSILNITFMFIVMLFVIDFIPQKYRFLGVFLSIVIRFFFIYFADTYPCIYQDSASVARIREFLYLLFFTAQITTTIYIATKDFSAMQQKLVAYNNKLHMAASIDPLTGLNNRRAMIDLMANEIKAYKKGDISSLCIAIADIDFFKKINDTYGHNGGDFVLKELASIFQSFMVNKGHVARWGGEEFLFIFHNINGDDSIIYLDSLRKKVSEYDFIFEETVIHLTISSGLTEFDSRHDMDSNVMDADQKLYLAKAQGRNRVIY